MGFLSLTFPSATGVVRLGSPIIYEPSSYGILRLLDTKALSDVGYLSPIWFMEPDYALEHIPDP